MKVQILDLNGKPSGEIELPKIFSEKHRPDIIKRVVLSLQSQRRQPYGSDSSAGFRTSAHYHGKRHMDSRQAMMNRDMARLPRLHVTSPHLNRRARRVPQSVKGRRAHPPKVEKIWGLKINKEEKRLGLRSAIAMTADLEVVKGRGHKIDKLKLPLVVKDDIQSIKKTKEIEKILKNFGLEKELERSKEKKIRAGKGKMRSRKYKRKYGPLLIVANDKGIAKAAKNISGLDVCTLNNMSVENLAPGAAPGRLTIYSKSSIEKLRGF